MRALLILAIMAPIVSAGCGPSAPAHARRDIFKEPDQPDWDKIKDPALKDARQGANSVLEDLIAGKFDSIPDLSTASRKAKGYRQYAIKSQIMMREGQALFIGQLKGPIGVGRFSMTIVKQGDGTWAIARFGGPEPEEI